MCMSHAQNLRIVSPDPERDRDAIIDLTGKTFGDSYFDWVERCKNGYLDNSPYDWKASRVAFAGDRLVGHFGVYDITQRVGRGTLRVAGIGAVACDAEFRKRGIVRAVATESVAGLAGAGYEVSLLYGIRNFYHRFGYVTGWPDYRWTVATCDLPAENTPDLDPIQDYVALADLANAWHDGVSGTAVRPTWRGNPRTGHTGYQWVDASGDCAGYIAYKKSDDTLMVTDAAGDPETVLAVCRDRAAALCAARVTFLAFPPDSPYVKALQKRPHTLTAIAEPDGGPMIRSVSLLSALRSLAPELEARLSAVGYPVPLSLELNDGRERVCIEYDPAPAGSASIRVTVVDDSGVSAGDHRLEAGDNAARLLYGTHSVDELVAEGLAHSTPGALQAARLFFPVCSPSLTAFDTM